MPIESYEDAVAYLDAHIGLGVEPGLDRIGRLLELMGDPQSAYPAIHIAGTNGKTTTALMCTSLLTAHGLSVGTFISPHLENVEERFRLAGDIADQEDFARAIADVEAFVTVLAAERDEEPTYFELTVAGAFAYFLEKAVDVAVVEVGLGGRLDATNVLASQVSVITSVGIDHTEYLGETIAEIAGEKLAIMTPGTVVVTGHLPDDAAALAGERTAEHDVERRQVDSDFSVEEATLAVGGWHLTVAGMYDTYADIFLPLHGRHQVDNFAVAIATVEALFGRALSEEAVVEAAAGIQSPGRIEVVGHNPLIVVDGAHNDQSMGALAGTIEEEFPALDWTVVFGALGDKDIEAMLGHLEDSMVRLIIAAPDSPRAADPAMMAATAERAFPDLDVSTAPSVRHAVVQALDETSDDGAILITGSLYVVGEARPAIRSQE